jgi:hypothetical protein
MAELHERAVVSMYASLGAHMALRRIIQLVQYASSLQTALSHETEVEAIYGQS